MANDLLEEFKSQHKEEIEEAQNKTVIVEEEPKPVIDNEIQAVEDNDKAVDKLIDSPVTTDTKQKTSEQIIEEQKQTDLRVIQADESFKKASKELNFRDVQNQLESSALVIADKELNNQYEKYKLDQKKELLKATVNAEKGLIKEQAKAEKYEKKRKIAEKRYGYLYETTEITVLDDEGNKIKKTVYKDFTPSKAINRFKEFGNWYKNLTDGARNFINTTCKFLLRVAGWAALGGILYGLITWLLHSGIAV